MFLDLDTWMVRLFGKDTRPEENVLAWYSERRERCRALLWDLAKEILFAGCDVFLELGLITNVEREAVYAKARDEDLRFIVYHLDAPRDVRRKRVVERNHSPDEHTQLVPSHFFELASDAWESPSSAEREAVGLIDI